MSRRNNGPNTAVPDSVSIKAIEFFKGDEALALEWLSTPREIFNGVSSAEHAKSDSGAQDVIDLLNRLQHGVFS